MVFGVRTRRAGGADRVGGAGRGALSVGRGADADVVGDDAAVDATSSGAATRIVLDRGIGCVLGARAVYCRHGVNDEDDDESDRDVSGCGTKADMMEGIVEKTRLNHLELKKKKK